VVAERLRRVHSYRQTRLLSDLRSLNSIVKLFWLLSTREMLIVSLDSVATFAEPHMSSIAGLMRLTTIDIHVAMDGVVRYAADCAATLVLLPNNAVFVLVEL
jgi:hypothetical protein